MRHINISLRRFFGPQNNRRYRGRYSTIGIDLGTARIKMLQLQQSRTKTVLFQESFLPTPEGAIVNGIIKEPSLLASHLKQVKEEQAWHGNRVSLCLDSRACYMRTVAMPDMKKNELRQAMRWEAKKHFPLAADEAVISFQQTGCSPRDSGTAREYLLAAAPRDRVEQYTQLALEAGFVLLALEVAPTALLRSVTGSGENYFTDQASHRLVIDCGNSTTELLLLDRNGYCFHRRLNIGITTFCRAAMAANEGDREAALRRTFSRADLSEKGLSHIASRLARGISESLDYWAEQDGHGKITLSAIEAGGGGIFIPGLASYLQHQLRQKFVIYNPLFKISPVSEPQTAASGQRGALFAVAHGLALRGWIQ